MRLLVIDRGPLGYLTDALKLCQYACRRHSVNFLSFEAPRFAGAAHSWPQVPGIETQALSVRGSLPVRLGRRLAACIRESAADYDLIYVYYFPGCSLLPLMHPGRHFVLDIRSGSIAETGFSRLVANVTLRFEAAFFRHVNVISEGLRDQLGLSHRARIVPLGADAIVLPAKRFSFVHLLYVGLLGPQRHLDRTIVGFARAQREFAGRLALFYTIVGDGPGRIREQLLDVARDQGVEQFVDMPGYIPHEQLRPYFEKCNAGLSYVPITPYFEHQPPTKTFEYLLTGMPVIATATNENRRIVNGRNGVLISDSAEGVYRGLHELIERRENYDSAAIRESAEQYTWANIMGREVPVLETLALTP